MGVEALLRWQRDGVYVRPDLYIPAAKDCRLISQFTDYVLTQIATDAPGFLKQHPECYISIYLSSADLQGGRIVESLGLTVIGEAIETEAQASFLRDYGVKYGQGWRYARAMPLPELLRKHA